MMTSVNVSNKKPSSLLSQMNGIRNPSKRWWKWIQKQKISEMKKTDVQMKREVQIKQRKEW